jgi:glutaredoxin
MELKVFTLPSCPTCPVAKTIVAEVAEELGILFREINMATQEGLKEGLSLNIVGTPSIVLNSEVVVRGRLISKEKLKEEVKKRLGSS